MLTTALVLYYTETKTLMWILSVRVQAGRGQAVNRPAPAELTSHLSVGAEILNERSLVIGARNDT